MLILSVRERNSFRTSIVHGKSGKTSSGIRIAKKKRRKENERVERGKEIVTSGLRMRIEEKIGRENGGIGHSLWRKEQERG